MEKENLENADNEALAVEAIKVTKSNNDNGKKTMSKKKLTWILTGISWGALLILGIFCLVSNFIEIPVWVASLFGSICMPIFIGVGIAGHTIAKRNKEDGCKVQYWLTFPSLFIIIPLFICYWIIRYWLPNLIKGIKHNM